MVAVLLLMCVLMTGAAAAAPSGYWTDTGNYATSFADGEGTSGNPYQISTAEQLALLAVSVNNESTTYENMYFKLTANIDLANHFWTPIGNTTESDVDISSTPTQMFKGTFDGNYHTISNMNVTFSSSDLNLYSRVGLFGYVTNAVIQNTGVVDAAVTNTVLADYTGTYSGGLVGQATGTGSITNCYTTGVITATTNHEYCTDYAGGMVGKVDGNNNNFLITNCYTTCAVSVFHPYSYTRGATVGGLAGDVSYITLTNCYATGKVTSFREAGGLLGSVFNSYIRNSIALNEWVNATDTSSTEIGRFIGSPLMMDNTNLHAWRQMELNNSGVITKPVPEEPQGKNATNASTAMIWNNQSFYEGLGWTFGDNWTMSTDPDYRLPILAWQDAAPVGVDVAYLNITHDVTLTISGGGTVVSDRTLPKVSDDATIIFTIAGTPTTFTDNGIDKKGLISAGTYTIPDLAENHVIVADFPLMPVVESAGITTYNTTVANITFSLNNSFPDADNGAWVNFTRPGSGTVISTKISTLIPKGSSVSVQLTGLTPGQSYQLNITPLNDAGTVTGGIPMIYHHPSLYSAPFPAITFVNATTGNAISDPLSLTNGQSVIIRANITNASTELKNETVNWGTVQGSGFTATDGETAYPYNITITATASNADANITVTLGSVSKKLNMTCAAVLYPLTVINGTGGGSSHAAGTSVPITLTAKTGYTFTGWTTESSGSFANANAESTTFTMPASAATVTAGLNPITYTVHYDGNGYGSGSTADSIHTYDVPANLATNGFTKTNYYFAGWNKTGPTGTVVDYTDAVPVVNLTSTSDATVTLYAVWSSVPVYSVTVTGGTGSGSFPAGTPVTISATVPSGKTFDHWTVSGATPASTTSATTTFVMPATAVTATAVFRDAPVPPVPPVPVSGGDGYSSTSSDTVSGTGLVSFGTATGITGLSFARGTAGTAVLDTKPSGVTAPDNSYALYDITAPAFEGYAQIEFSVPAAILSDQGLTANDVVLQHYVNGKWVKLQTTCLGEIQGAVRYVAFTKSFSPFAIVYEKDGAKTIGQATPEPTKQQSSSKTAAGTPVPTATSTQQATATTGTTVPATAAATGTATEAQPTLTQAPAPVVGALLGLLAAGILLRRKD